MPQYLEGSNYLLLVITGFTLLLLIFLTIAYRSLDQENSQLRLTIAKLTRHPSTIASIPDEFTMLTEREAAALLAMDDRSQPMLPGFDLHVDQALRLANGR